MDVMALGQMMMSELDQLLRDDNSERQLQSESESKSKSKSKIDSNSNGDIG